MSYRYAETHCLRHLPLFFVIIKTSFNTVSFHFIKNHLLKLFIIRLKTWIIFNTFLIDAVTFLNQFLEFVIILGSNLFLADIVCALRIRLKKDFIASRINPLSMQVNKLIWWVYYYTLLRLSRTQGFVFDGSPASLLYCHRRECPFESAPRRAR